MTPLQLRWVFVLLYVGIDLLYVLASKGFYEIRIKAIQGGPSYPQKPLLPLAVVATYGAMGLGWWFLVARPIDRRTPWRKIVGLALVFALIVHGVFNGTLYSMFKHWDGAAVVRDVAWGIVWISTVTLLYGLALKRLPNA